MDVKGKPNIVYILRKAGIGDFSESTGNVMRNLAILLGYPALTTHTILLDEVAFIIERDYEPRHPLTFASIDIIELLRKAAGGDLPESTGFVMNDLSLLLGHTTRSICHEELLSEVADIVEQNYISKTPLYVRVSNPYEIRRRETKWDMKTSVQKNADIWKGRFFALRRTLAAQREKYSDIAETRESIYDDVNEHLDNGEPLFKYELMAWFNSFECVVKKEFIDSIFETIEDLGIEEPKASKNENQ